MKSLKIWFISITISLVLIAAFLGVFTSFILSRFTAFELLFTMSPSSVQIQEMNILLLGVDATAGVRRSDTIMVAHVDPKERTVNLVSIPRDMMVVIPGVRLDKINHAYAFGGPELACATTAGFLGIPIEKYIKINIDSLAKIIDRIGGVTVDVDQKMYYVDYAGGLFIDLKPGKQHLTGKQIIGYLRFRHDAKGDIGRIQRQQRFLQELGAEIAKTKNFMQIYQILLDMAGGVETNMGTSQILALASVVRQAYEMGGISVNALYGSGTMIDGVYYMQPDMYQVSRVVSRYLKSK